MDLEGLERLLQRMEAGRIDIRCLDLTAPSPLSAEIINARPYAFLDDGDAENRRSRAIGHTANDLANAATLSIISVSATEQVKAEAWIQPRNRDELHDGLLQLGFLTQGEYSSGCSSNGTAGDAARWNKWFKALAGEMRACCVRAGSRLLQTLEKTGAMFSADLEHESGLLSPQFEQVIATLVARGLDYCGCIFTLALADTA